MLGADNLPAVAEAPPSAVRFGLDMFSVNQQNWTPFQQLDFAAKRDANFSRFLTLCDNGKPVLEPPPDPAVSQAERQIANVEASIKWTQAFLAKL